MNIWKGLSIWKFHLQRQVAGDLDDKLRKRGIEYLRKLRERTSARGRHVGKKVLFKLERAWSTEYCAHFRELT
jgi:hypothetical protein